MTHISTRKELLLHTILESISLQLPSNTTASIKYNYSNEAAVAQQRSLFMFFYKKGDGNVVEKL